MRDKRKAKSCPRGLNHLSRPPRVSFPPIRRSQSTSFVSNRIGRHADECLVMTAVGKIFESIICKKQSRQCQEQMEEQMDVEGAEDCEELHF
jgi:hypothetical protein